MSDWISVEKQLPEQDIDVLVIETERRNTYWVAQHDGIDFIENQECMIIEATHWMPLPEPPL